MLCSLFLLSWLSRKTRQKSNLLRGDEKDSCVVIIKAIFVFPFPFRFSGLYACCFCQSAFYDASPICLLVAVRGIGRTRIDDGERGSKVLSCLVLRVFSP